LPRFYGALLFCKDTIEARIRQNAANRSYSVILGQVTEHLIPFHTKFPFNPKDSRFIGSPIDLIVFDGVSDELDEVTIYFVEIKTGRGYLSSKQKKIKDAVDNNRVKWHLVKADEI
jgi:predicted Holliday junction resolvase-like endonuclease